MGAIITAKIEGIRYHAQGGYMVTLSRNAVNDDSDAFYVPEGSPVYTAITDSAYRQHGPLRIAVAGIEILGIDNEHGDTAGIPCVGGVISPVPDPDHYVQDTVQVRTFEDTITRRVTIINGATIGTPDTGETRVDRAEVTVFPFHGETVWQFQASGPLGTDRLFVHYHSDDSTPAPSWVQALVTDLLLNGAEGAVKA